MKTVGEVPMKKENRSVPVVLSALLFCCSLALASSSTSTAATDEFRAQLEQHKEYARLAGYGEERLSSVLVTGTLFCDPCSFEHGSKLASSSSSSSSSYVTGAQVAVACEVDGGSRKHAYGTTDEYGEFIIDLPSQLHAIQIADDCTVKVLGTPKVSPCRRPTTKSTRTGYYRIRLSSVGNSIRVYSAGTIRLARKIKSSVPPE